MWRQGLWKCAKTEYSPIAKEASNLTGKATPLTRLVPCNQQRRGRFSWLRDTPRLEEERDRERERSFSLASGPPAYSCARRVEIGKGEHTHASTMTCLCIYVSTLVCRLSRDEILDYVRVSTPCGPLPPPSSTFWYTNPLRHSLPAVASLMRQRHPKVYRVPGSPLTLATLICYQAQISGAVIWHVFEKLKKLRYWDRLRDCKFLFGHVQVSQRTR